MIRVTCAVFFRASREALLARITRRAWHLTGYRIDLAGFNFKEEFECVRTHAVLD